MFRAKQEIKALSIYKRRVARMEEVDKINIDLKNNISQLKDELKEKDKSIKQRELEITSLTSKLGHKGEEISQLKDNVVEVEAEVQKYKNIRIDLMSQIEKLSTELERVNEELDERNRRLEYAENMNFNEYSDDGLNFDLSERIKSLEEEKDELINKQNHEDNIVVKTLESKVEKLENDKKQLLQQRKRDIVKYDRYEQEREAKELISKKIKILEKERNIANMEKKKLSDRISNFYKEISRLKNFENENKSLKRDKTELLEELQKASKENHNLQKKIIMLHEKSRFGNELNIESDQESPICEESQILQNSKIYSNSKDRSIMDLSFNKSGEYYEEDFSPANSKSMVIGRKLDRSKYLTANPRLNETMISDRSTNRFQKKILLDKDREIDSKNKEIEDVTKKYEEKIRELNKSRNDEREKYETKLQGLGKSFKTLTTRNKGRNLKARAKTPIVSLDQFIPDKKKEMILGDIDDIEDENSDSDEGENKQIFEKFDQFHKNFETLRKSLANEINDNEKDSKTVSNMMNNFMDDDLNYHYPMTTKST